MSESGAALIEPRALLVSYCRNDTPVFHFPLKVNNMLFVFRADLIDCVTGEVIKSRTKSMTAEEGQQCLSAWIKTFINMAVRNRAASILLTCEHHQLSLEKKEYHEVEIF